jgi:D-alanyl-lipoteichoic acid acyltransferase DltB (MBOAT superfamily)
LALFFVIISTYTFGIKINSCKNKNIKTILFCSGFVINIAILIGTRYIGYFVEIVHLDIYKNNSIWSFDNNNIILSVGVSFYVFQAISYLIDVYIEIEEPERHIGYFALYMCFFAKLLQGPIERSNELLPQLKTEKYFNISNINAGIFLFTWGIFKKVIVADRLSLFVDTVYDDVYSYSGLQLILATYYYSIQIYCDFSGYTDMALGSARFFGINLTQNFNNPYLSTSIAEFWRRWHISLSRWILDYIFKPLQMQFRGLKNFGSALSLIVTFLVCGAWHGVSFGFLIWGLLHGIYMAISIYYKYVQKYLRNITGSETSIFRNIWKVFFTFNIVSFSWIFFRSNNISDAFYIVSHLFVNITQTISKLLKFDIVSVLDFISFHGSRRELLLAFMGTTIIVAVGSFKKSKQFTGIDSFLNRTPYLVKWSLYYSLLLLLVMCYYDSEGKFIYFTF